MGYWYEVDGSYHIRTGYGGAQMMYKNFLAEGMSEEMIEQVIYVYIGKESYPLAALTVKYTDGKI
jgi:hypothetical protein